MAGSIYLPILSSFNPAGVNAARTSLGGLSGAFDGVRRAVGLASASYVAFRAISETIDFGRSSIMAARDFEQNLIGLDAIFGDLSPRMQQFAKDAEAIGLSQNQAAQASTFIGSVLKQAGFQMDDVASQTENLVSIASDLAFVYKYPVSEALSGITALFRGEYDPIEKFGVAMKQSEVNSLLAENGMSKLTGAARRNQEQMARLALFLDRTSDAQGKFKESSGSLAAEQQRLQGIFANLQIEVGKALVPALVAVAEALQPLVKTLGPAITTLFVEFAGIITILAGELGDVQSNFNNFVKVLGLLFGVLKDILPWVLDNALAIGVFAASFVAVRSAVLLTVGTMEAYKTVSLAAAAAQGKFNAAFLLTPWGAAAIGIGLVVTALVNVSLTADKVGDSYDVANGKQEAFYKAASGNMAGLAEAQAKFAAQNQFTGPNLGFLPKDVAKKLTASELLASNYGAGAGKVGGKTSVIGQADEIKTATSDLEKTLQQYMDSIRGITAETAKTTGKAGAATKDTVEAQKKALAELKKEFLELGQAVKPLAQATREIGEFERNSIDSFDAIIKKLQDSVADGKISAAASSSIQAYVAIERKALEDLGRQRDEILKKRGLAETLIADIKSAIIGVGGLAGLLETETRQITVATTKIVDGFVITTKRTVDEIVGGQGVLSKLTAVVAKTKAFAAQLTQLKKLGLNENLFKQIVEAGPDVGGQLATEILAGGADSVSALNTTFKELEDVAGQVAEQTAVVMYNSGVEVAGGLVNGLLSQEAQLIAAANKLADAFNAAYKLKIDALQVPTGGGPAVDTSGGIRLGDIKLAGEKVGASAQEQANAALAAKLINTDKFTAFGSTSYIFNIESGPLTTTKQQGKVLTSLLNQYGKSSK